MNQPIKIYQKAKKKMKPSLRKLFFLSLLTIAFFACEEEQDPPMLENVEPIFGPAETLVTFEGTNLHNLREMTFSGQSVNFNTAYNSDNALLFRIPTNVPLGDHEVILTTDGGSVSTNFKVTLEPPEIFEIVPESASPGETVAILGKNFFEPLEVFFFEDVPAEITFHSPDSIEVIVPEGVQKGRITVEANGGPTLSPVNFFSVNSILVNDFDGNGLRPNTIQWVFVGEIDQTPLTAVQETNPAPVDGKFLKLSGSDVLDIGWIGGTQTNYGFPGDTFTDFGITTDLSNTLIEMDIHNNGRDNTHIILILLENDGSPNDFTTNIHVDWNGWEKISIPLSRFEDLNGIPIDPAKVRTLKIHLIDEEDSNEPLEVNVDNIRFVEII